MLGKKALNCDLEGFISGQDHAHATCKRYVKDGDRLFPVVSRYDDLLTLQNREGYEPGETLMLIIPFLIEAGVTEEDLKTVSAKAGLVLGICELFSELQNQGCFIYVISTSYEQHALSIAQRVGVPLKQVYCTRFPLDQLQKEVSKEALSLVREVREGVVSLYQEDLESGVRDEAIVKLLNPFYWKKLPKTKLGQVIAKIKVMGGRRKVWALEEAIRNSGGNHLCEAFVVGDSITDFRMAQAVEAAGGIALAWNANRYLLPYASCGVAAIDARAVRPLFKAWQKGGRAAVRGFIENTQAPKDPELGPYYHWLAGKDEEFQKEVLAIHKKLRIICRGRETAKLG